MTLEKIREMARELRAKTRRELFGNIAAAVIAVGVSGRGLTWTRDPVMRVAFAIAIAWALAGQYLVNRGMWSPMMAGDAGLSSGIEFYRREVERRRNIFGRLLQWSFGPVVLSIGALILVLSGIAKEQGRAATAVIPFATAFAMWVVLIFVRRSRTQRELQREMDELRAMERG